VLVLAELVGLRTEDGWFPSSAIATMFEELRLPRPLNIPATLTNLRTAGLLVSRGSGVSSRWSLTPLGHKRASEVVGEIDPDKLEAQLATVPGAELGHARHTTLPPTLAPAKWAAGIGRLLERFPFDTTVLCMTRFPDPDSEDDPNAAVIDATKEALAKHGLVLHLASDGIVDEDLLGNVAAYMWACQYGIGLFEDRIGKGLNYNLVTEVGAMVMAGRRCALLKDTTVPTMPTDLIGQIYKPVDFGEVKTVSAAAHLWAADDLGLGRCKDCP
jgi:hypothetical protein